MKTKIVYDMSLSESLIMKFLWREGEKSFVEIMTFLSREEGKEWKKQTINTFIKRLSNKGLIAVDNSGKYRVYRAAVTNVEYERGRARKFLGDFYNGSVYLFLSALTGGKEIDKAFADGLRAMVESEFTREED